MQSKVFVEPEVLLNVPGGHGRLVVDPRGQNPPAGQISPVNLSVGVEVFAPP